MTHRYVLPLYDEYLAPRWEQMKNDGTLPSPDRSELSIRITTMSRNLGDVKAECFGEFVTGIMLHFKHLSDGAMPPSLVYSTKSVNRGVGITGDMDKMPDKLIQLLTIFLDDYNAVPTKIPAKFMTSE